MLTDVSNLTLSLGVNVYVIIDGKKNVCSLFLNKRKNNDVLRKFLFGTFECAFELKVLNPNTDTAKSDHIFPATKKTSLFKGVYFKTLTE